MIVDGATVNTAYRWEVHDPIQRVKLTEQHGAASFKRAAALEKLRLPTVADGNSFAWPPLATSRTSRQRLQAP